METSYSPQTVDVYLSNGGVVCPECGSSNIEILPGSSQCQGLTASHEVRCCACGEHYREVFKLTRIEPAQPF